MPKSREPTRRLSKRLRCAIYTRKSSDEGLEQAFNSLDAQREACASFVLSQKHEGWSLLPTLYDDGGYSGGTLDRPALQRLLADIADAKVHVVVVYKIDRLTRSRLTSPRSWKPSTRAPSPLYRSRSSSTPPQAWAG